MTTTTEDDLWALHSQETPPSSQEAKKQPAVPVAAAGVDEFSSVEEQRLWYLQQQIRLCIKEGTRYTTPQGGKCPTGAHKWDRPGKGNLFICRLCLAEHYCGYVTGGLMACNHRDESTDSSWCTLTGTNMGPSDLKPEAGKEWSGEAIVYKRAPGEPPKERTLRDAVKTEQGPRVRGDQAHAFCCRALNLISRLIDKKKTLRMAWWRFAAKLQATEVLQQLDTAKEAKHCVDLWTRLSCTNVFRDNQSWIKFERFCCTVVYSSDVGHPSGLIKKNAFLFAHLRGLQEACAIVGAGARPRWFTDTKNILQDCLNEAAKQVNQIVKFKQ